MYNNYQDNIFVVVRKNLEVGTYEGTIQNAEVRNGKLYFTIYLHDNGRLFMPVGFNLTLSDDSCLYRALKNAGFSDDGIQALSAKDFIDKNIVFDVENEAYSSNSICQPVEIDFPQRKEVSA